MVKSPEDTASAWGDQLQVVPQAASVDHSPCQEGDPCSLQVRKEPIPSFSCSSFFVDDTDFRTSVQSQASWATMKL